MVQVASLHVSQFLGSVSVIHYCSTTLNEGSSELSSGWWPTSLTLDLWSLMGYSHHLWLGQYTGSITILLRKSTPSQLLTFGNRMDHHFSNV
jgi:hypothetical protein